MEQVALPTGPLTAEGYVEWSLRQEGRYELHEGQVVRMQAERNAHSLVETRITIAFGNALVNHPSNREVFADGASVRISDHTVYEPDETIACGESDMDGVYPADPTVVVEVGSPSTEAQDKGEKFGNDFKVPSICHDLFVSIRNRTIVHHGRVGEKIESTIFGEGVIELDPLGIELEVKPPFARPEPR